MIGTEKAPEGLRGRNKRDKLDRIRAAARELFSEKGFEATTAREICQRAEIGNGTLFLYARDKREILLLVVAEEARERMRAALAEAVKQTLVCDALMTFFGRFLDAYEENPAFARVVAGEFFFRSDETPAMAELNRQFFDCIATLVSRARELGELRTDVSIEEQVKAYFAHYSLHVQFWLGGIVEDRRQTERAIERAFELQTQGMASNAPRSSELRPTPTSGRVERKGRSR
jgi:AcrR family transcriptional regulator